MLRLASSLRSPDALRAIKANAGARTPVAFFSTSFVALAPKVVPGGKKKIRQGYGSKKAGETAKAKPKKGGMTHLKFRDAVRELGFEKNADSTVQLSTLSAQAVVADSDSAIVKYSAATYAALDTLKAFKKYQHHELFKEPASMVTDNTRALFDVFVSALESPEQNRVCLLGDKGSGKSALITQVQALALEQNPNTILIHLDHPEKIVDGTSDYIFNSKTKKYQQPMFTKRWIIRLREANKTAFSSLKLSQDVTFAAKSNKGKAGQEVTLKKDVNTVYEFLQQNHDFGREVPTSAFEFFVNELKHHSKDVPVVVTVDNATGIINEPISKYFHADYTPIHVSDFEVGSFLLDVISGDISFAKGGVLMAESSDNRKCSTLDVGLGLQEFDPYSKPDECDVAVANRMLSNGGIASYELANLSKDQVRDLMSFWEASGVFHVRDYSRKEASADTEQAEQAEFDADEAFERAVQNNYTLTSGNVGGLVKVSNFLF